MEVKEKIAKQTTKTYVACDGREFDTKYACMNHERKIKADEARKRIETLPNFEMSSFIPSRSRAGLRQYALMEPLTLAKAG